jgi:hydroxymethylpyrimidine/phosphomethylpyrimidine kinase
LSTAVSTLFWFGISLNKSCELATKYVLNAIGSDLKYGKGHGPINHLNSVKVSSKYK